MNIESSGSDANIQHVVRAASEQLQDLMRQRADVTKRIGTIKQTLAGLANLFGDSVLTDELLTFIDRRNSTRQVGFTRALRLVLIDAQRPLGVRHVCEELNRKFPNLLSRHKDPLASVTTVLNRLVAYGEARSQLDLNGRRVWEWVAEKNELGSSHHSADEKRTQR
jgi:hypothetical protein